MRGEETVPQLAARYHIHPAQINSWKRHLTERASDLFGKNNDANTKSGHSTDDLHRVIGELTVERNFLARKLNH